MIRWWYVAVEGVRFAWACRQKARGFPWTALPIPPREWVKWRLDTAYGEHFPRPSLRRIFDDVCVFLLWRRRMGLLRKVPR